MSKLVHDWYKGNNSYCSQYYIKHDYGTSGEFGDLFAVLTIYDL